jgi:4-amino-4-deoxy-L-arabinose transferase-like glycosyltransferase
LTIRYQLRALGEALGGFGAASLLLLLFAAWLLPGLLGHDPWKPDEAYTFGLVYHIVQSDDWLVPTLAGEPFVEKPPLFFWTAALFARAFAGLLPLHDAARLASAFYVALALFFTWLAADRRVAAPLVLAGCLGYLQHAHQLLTDNALMAGMAMGLYGLRESRGWLLGTGAGIAFLSKGLIGPGVLGLTALLLPLLPAWRASWRRWGWALLAFAPWALVWPWLLYRHSPELFHEWFWVNNFGRFTRDNTLGGVLDHWHYAKALPWFALPAWPLALWTLARRPGVPEVQFGFVSFAVIFGVLSIASSARTLYGLPMLLPLALLAAVELDSLPRWLAWPVEKLALWGSALAGVALWAAWLAFVFGWRAPFLTQASPGFAPRIEPALLAAAVAVTLAWALSLGLEPRLPVRWLAGVTLAWGLAMTLWLPWLDHAKSYRGMIADLQEHRPKLAGCVASRGLGEPQRAMLHYFAGMLTERREGADCPLLLIETAENRPPEPGPQWRLAWRGTRPGDSKEWFWLFARF